MRSETRVLWRKLDGLKSNAQHPALQAFPAAQEGLERFVIVLPEKERGEEDAFRVEIIVGKDMLTDGVNLVQLAHTIETRVFARPRLVWITQRYSERSETVPEPM